MSHISHRRNIHNVTGGVAYGFEEYSLGLFINKGF